MQKTFRLTIENASAFQWKGIAFSVERQRLTIEKPKRLFFKRLCGACRDKCQT